MSVSEGVLLGIGNPLLDISAAVPESLLQKYDVKPNNAILAEDKHMPLYQELVDEHSVEYIAGGATQNGIRVAQWMLQETPRATTFLGCVGVDFFGKKLEDAAQKDQVNVHYMKIQEKPTGTCAVLINKENRSLVANISAAGSFSIDFLKQEDSQALIQKAKYFYMAGFFLTSSPESALYLAEYAHSNNKTFAMNLAAPFICQFFYDKVMSLMPYVTYVFGNETEARAFAETSKWETSDIVEIAKKISQLPKAENNKFRVAVITQGPDNTVVAIGDEIHQFPVTPIPKEEMVDTNAAGDAFVGGFLSQLVSGKPLAVSVAAGHYAAGVVIRHSGCTFPATHSFDPTK
eukprot:c14924_g1_i1.p1 GENE.c14924_g1_i1~~c14924_g1_i1.p1  ORF type:complete len:354 (+),score=149.65 c14924_g1_i1:23-1063(+)